MNLEQTTLSQFDPSGIRRMVARFLDLGSPVSQVEAERLINCRLGPYGLDGGMISEEINTYFTARH